MIRPEDLDLPLVNAGLNGASAILLTAGYAAIRRRWILLHAGCMVLALVVSALFLTSYLYYHIAVRNWQPTTFTGQTWALRSFYLTLLASHTVLAALVPPLALTTVYLVLRRKFSGHVRLARWTLPLWWYVSITGVLVYLMLYHLPDQWKGG